MPATAKEYPFYIKSTVIVLGLVLLSFSLFHLRSVFAPIAFSLIIAMVLNPAVNKLQQKGLSKTLAISIAVISAVLLFSAVLYFVSAQFAGFTDNLPEMKVRFVQQMAVLHNWIADHMRIPVAKQNALVSQAMNNSKALFATALGGLLSTLEFFVLVPIYIFMLLYYKNLFLNFFHESFHEENSTRVSDVLDETKKAIQSYMIGLLLEALVVSLLNTGALLLLGVKYALLLGVVGGLLNMLPYIGGLMAIALPVLITIVTKDGFSTPLGIFIAYTIIQFVDNHFLVPFLVSSRVKINAFFSIVIVLLGGALWGVAGMFLSIPFLAIVKIIFDRIPELKPWGKLLGSAVPVRHKGEIWGRRRRKTAVAEKIVEKAAS